MMIISTILAALFFCIASFCVGAIMGSVVEARERETIDGELRERERAEQKVWRAMAARRVRERTLRADRGGGDAA